MKTITLTSKNQITIPADIVKAMKLQKSKRLTVVIKDESIVLQPVPEPRKRIVSMWERNAPIVQSKKPLTDTQLKQIKKEAWEEHVAQKVKDWQNQGI